MARGIWNLNLMPSYGALNLVVFYFSNEFELHELLETFIQKKIKSNLKIEKAQTIEKYHQIMLRIIASQTGPF